MAPTIAPTIGRLRRLGHAALGQVLPQRCVLCGTADADRHFCRGCARLLPRIDSACARCGRPFATPQPAHVTCAACQSDAPAFFRAAAAFRYTFPIDSALKAFKFRRQLHYVPAFAGELVPLLERYFDTCDVLVPVPLHRWRHARRGFNQAYELCRALSQRSGIPLGTPLRRVRATRPQPGLTAAERRRNLRGAFALCAGLTYRRPVIVDDVMTTGETCNQAARVLLHSGADAVGVLTVARA